MPSFSITKASIGGLALTIALSLAAMPSTTVAAEELRFLVFGDAPYKRTQIERLNDTVAPAIGNDEASFLIHVGDFKAGKESCTETLIDTRYKQLMKLRPGRVFYTPGDNEWTDCDRPDLTQRFPESKRLNDLRKLIKSSRLKLPTDWRYDTQPGFPENARWTQGNVIFATVHMVGTNNGREEICLGDIEAALKAVDDRDRANLAWLGEAFDKADESGAVVIATQADVTKLARYEKCSDPLPSNYNAFAAFRDELLRHAAGFGKPVLLVHGDTHPFCLDKNFGEDSAPKLWRLNALGDGTEVDATVITVQLDNEDQPFKIEPMTTKAELKDCSQVGRD